MRMQTWYEDRFSPFSEMYKKLQTVPGVIYRVQARLKVCPQHSRNKGARNYWLTTDVQIFCQVDWHDPEFYALQFRPSAAQPCASGMVSVENCPRYANLKLETTHVKRV